VSVELPLPKASPRDFAAWLVGRRMRTIVINSSMEPTLQPGDHCFVKPYLGLAEPEPGHVVMVEHPEYGNIVKRIHHIEADGSLWLIGDNAHAENAKDSRHSGAVKRTHLRGRVVSVTRAGQNR